MKISKWLVVCGAIVLGGMAGGLVARSESNHHVELSGSACRSGGQTIVSYEAHSWDMGSAGGLNDAVKVEVQYKVGNAVSGYEYVTTGAFVDPNRSFSGVYTISVVADAVKLISTVMKPWGNGARGGQVNVADVQIVDCAPTPTATETETPMPSSTPTFVAATATPTPTTTAAIGTSTVTATATQVNKETGEPATSTATFTATSTATPTATTTRPAIATATPAATTTATATSTATPTATATKPCNELPDCAPTGSDEEVEKEVPPEISDPPSIARWYVYLPNVSR